MLGILLVDDEKYFVKEMEVILKADPFFQILANCCSGVAALNIMEELNPDVLIADVIMPGMSGLELARKVKHLKPSLPIILMSDDPSYAVKGFDIGISGFLLKPLLKEKVHETLCRLLNK